VRHIKIFTVLMTVMYLFGLAGFIGFDSKLCGLLVAGACFLNIVLFYAILSLPNFHVPGADDDS